VFVLEAYTPAQLTFDTGGPRSVELLMTAALLREELVGLDFEIMRELERDVIEGGGHTAAARLCRYWPAGRELGPRRVAISIRTDVRQLLNSRRLHKHLGRNPGVFVGT